MILLDYEQEEEPVNANDEFFLPDLVQAKELFPKWSS